MAKIEKKASRKANARSYEMAQSQATTEGSLFESLVEFARRLERFHWAFGVLFVSIAGMTLLSLIGMTSGAWLTPWAAFLRVWLGWGSALVPLSFGVWGLRLLTPRREELATVGWARVIALELAGFALLATLTLIGGSSLERAEAGLDGGLIGWGTVEFGRVLLSKFLPEVLVAPLLGIGFGLATLAGAVIGLSQGGRMLSWLRKRVEVPGGREIAAGLDTEPAVSVAPVQSQRGSQKEEKATRAERRTYIPPEFRKQFRVDEGEERPAEAPPRDDRLPPLDILSVEQTARPNERHINQTAGLIEKTLDEFGIPARVVGFQVGPTVTQFAVEPGYIQKEEDENGQKVRVAQITSLQRDLALALSAQRLRIQAPVPGRSYVGIEVPNVKSTLVRLRSILESDDFYKVNSPLAIALGRDVSGQVVVADLASMPHLLIAGTTGSGKSVCIAAITVCLAMNNSPADLRLVMIDPKMVELVPFNGLPHLHGKVETDLERIATVLRWVVHEMEERYKLLEEMRVRDLEAYNRKARRRKEYEPLPRIVVLVDELADLMMSAAEQTEATLVRLAQMARATGIHLVVATQRPSTDVVTGLIKANFPARLSFAVASGVDSRVILDSPGAESLLGRGDMLFLPPEAGAPVRSQGVIVTDQEIEKVITFWQKAWQAPPEEEAPWDTMIANEEMLDDRDDLVDQAIEALRESGKVSASFLQRQLRIGYPRAARLMDELEDLGIVGPARGGGRERELLLDGDEGEEYEET